MLKMQVRVVLKFIVSIIKCYWSLIDWEHGTKEHWAQFTVIFSSSRLESQDKTFIDKVVSLLAYIQTDKLTPFTSNLLHL